MKKLKRVLSITLCVLIIFTILCISISANSPMFPEWDMSSKMLYSPASNLQSILLYNDVYNDDVAVLTSPHSLITRNPLDGWAYDEELEYSHYIGTYYDSSGRQRGAMVTSYYKFMSGVAGPYAECFVDYSMLIRDYQEFPYKFTFLYGESVIPLWGTDPYATDVGSYAPFSPRYRFELGYWDFVDYRPYIQADVSISLLCFTYSFEGDSYLFSEEPHFETFEFSIVKTLEVDDALSEEEGTVMYSPLDIDLNDDIRDLAIANMSSTTINSGDNNPAYAVIDNMTVDLKLGCSNPDFDPGNLYIQRIGTVDYFFGNDNSSNIRYYPDLDQFTEWFNKSYPVYTLPEEFLDLDFTDFLSSVLQIFEVPLFGYFSLSDLLFGIAGVGLLIWFLKMFAGG